MRRLSFVDFRLASCKLNLSLNSFIALSFLFISSLSELICSCGVGCGGVVVVAISLVVAWLLKLVVCFFVLTL
ncbi:hypothetical protein YZ82_00070 [Campylobacter hyointestinalis]|uniref:Uncharacterized protein n=1 Tax=Campylobacter hyointestinalis TaxID=198 RepID=A0A562XM84_CAMHY|nr:hypothetical protein YZ82_00070 [Campylobacter hyointestinalis]